MDSKDFWESNKKVIEPCNAVIATFAASGFPPNVEPCCPFFFFLK